MHTETLDRAHWALIGFGVGAIALMAAAVMTSGVMSHDPETEKSIGTLMGEIARDMRAAATGAEPPVAPSAPATRSLFDVGGVLWYVVPVFGMLAAFLGGISLYKHEPAGLAKLAIGMGIGAVIMQYAFWIALLICGTMLLVAIVGNIGDIIGG